MKSALSISVVVVFGMIGGSLTAEELSSQEQLKAWAKDFVGTWVGDESTLDSDVPGLGKKGDKIAVQGTIEPASGIYQITWETKINGKLTTAGMAIVGWDASRKKVTSRFFNKHGGSGVATYTKRGNEWVTRNVTVEADGTKSTQDAVLTVTDTQHRYKIRNRKQGDESLPDKEQNWTKQK